jgi:hypothetical protein
MASAPDRRDPTKQARRRPGRRLSDLTDPENPCYVRVSEVARYFNVDRRVVEKWSEAGLLPIRRFPHADRIALVDIVSFTEVYHASGSDPSVAESA